MARVSQPSVGISLAKYRERKIVQIKGGLPNASIYQLLESGKEVKMTKLSKNGVKKCQNDEVRL